MLKSWLAWRVIVLVTVLPSTTCLTTVVSTPSDPTVGVVIALITEDSNA